MYIIVGVADMKVSDDPGSVLITYSLGSCIGVAIYDPAAKVGGLLHYMLPESSLDGIKAKKNPYMFGDTGIPLLFKESYKLGAKKNRLKVLVAGGAQILDQKGLFNIGKRNHTLLRKMFWKNNVMTDFEDVGGNVNRTLKLEIESGQAWLKTEGVGEKKIWGK
ncbi:MAG: chemotaxis protein CheD [Deltaproteobacteria bacterium]|nr:chemotaxis protein CheD [Deltaproteobacteria bacterium]RLB21718.1 MAG: chemotaxis protein CheD [Deltaproteobacteria bacterium]